MGAALITTQLNIGPLGVGAQITVAHGIRYGGLPRKPNIVMPDRQTAIGVIALDETNVTFKNLGTLQESASFFVELEHTIQRETASTATQIWKG